jgi:hypothetical protein
MSATFVTVRSSQEEPMKKRKRMKLEAAGWKVGTVQQFLGLTREEAAYVELKLALARSLKRKRRALRVTQVSLARRIRSSQSRVAKMEAGDPSVSIDLLVRSLLALGTPGQKLKRSMPT